MSPFLTDIIRKKYFKDVLALIIVLLISLWICAPLFQNALPKTHDSLASIVKYLSMEKFIGHGQLLPRWIPDYHGGYGGPLFNFYPPLFFLIAFVVSLFIKGSYLSINFASFLVYTGTGVTMYFLGRALWGRMAGLVSASAYLLAPYHLVDLYVRGAQSESTALIFLPLIFLGILMLFRNKCIAGTVLFSGGIFGIMISHSLTTMLFMPFALIYFLVLLAISLERGNFFIHTVSAFLVGVGLAAFFWVPMMFEKVFIHQEVMTAGYFNYTKHFVYPFQLIRPFWGYVNSPHGFALDRMSYSVGWVHLLLSVMTLLLMIRPRFSIEKVTAVVLALIAISAAFLTTAYSQIIWVHAPLLSMAQFPWRFLSIVAFALSVLAGGLLTRIPHMKWRIAGGCLCVAVLIIVNINYAKPVSTVSFPGLTTDTFYVSRTGDIGEFTPIQVKFNPPEEKLQEYQIIGGNLWINRAMSVTPVNHVLYVTAQTTSVVCRASYYFPGWTVRIDDKETSFFSNPYGFMCFVVSPGKHKVNIDFGATPIRLIAVGISWTSAAVLIFLLFLYSRRRDRGILDRCD